MVKMLIIGVEKVMSILVFLMKNTNMPVKP